MTPLTRSVEADIREFLKSTRELMFNERDFQMHLALRLAGSGRYDDVDLEYAIPNGYAVRAGYEWDSDIKLDIVVRRGEEYCVIELKYPTRRIVASIERFGKKFPAQEIVKNHGAQDLVSYNFWKDVRRIEVMKNLFAAVGGGIAVMLTNEPYYLSGPGQGTICGNFSTRDGRTVAGHLDWVRHTATSKGHPGFRLDNEYTVKWNQCEISDNKFYFTTITI